MVMKAYGHEATLAGKTENPAEIVRTEKLQAKARMVRSVSCWRWVVMCPGHRASSSM